MGRPLFSTLYASAAPAVRVVEAPTPTYERWSYVNAFDPDADEFFEGDNCVHEDFLPLQDTSVSVSSPIPGLVHQSTQSDASEHLTTDMRDASESLGPHTHQAHESRARLTLRDLADIVMPSADDFPDLMSASDDASTASEASNSGRSTPAYVGSSLLIRRRQAVNHALSDQMRRARSSPLADMEFDDVMLHNMITERQDAVEQQEQQREQEQEAATETSTSAVTDVRMHDALASNRLETSERDDLRQEENPEYVRAVENSGVTSPSPQQHGRTHSSDWNWSRPLSRVFTAPDDLLDDLPMPASPRPVPARAVSPGPTPGSFDAFVGSPGSLAMTPPGSVTPRFLTWGPSSSRRPRAVDMSPSPTPDAPFGSARALAYISSPTFVRVHQ